MIGKMKIKVGEYDKLPVATKLISTSSALEPAVSTDSLLFDTTLP